MDNRTFLEQYLAGEAVPEDIDDFVSRWHDDADIYQRYPQLHKYLGLTWDEYASWVDHPPALLSILRDYMSKK